MVCHLTSCGKLPLPTIESFCVILEIVKRSIDMSSQKECFYLTRGYKPRPYWD